MRRFWTPDEDLVVRYHYPRLPLTDLAAALGRGEGAVRKRANDLGVTRGTRALTVPAPNAKRPWTRADDDHLREWLGPHSHGQMAKHLGRSVDAVRVRCKRLGIRRATNVLTLNQVAQVFGVDCHLPKRWVDDGWLTARRLPLHTSQGAMYDVSPTALERFIRQHPAAYPWHRMEVGYYRDLAERVWRADPLLTTAEAARVLGVSRNWVASLIRAGELAAVKGYRLGRSGEAGWYVRRSVVRGYHLRRPELAGRRGPYRRSVAA